MLLSFMKDGVKVTNSMDKSSKAGRHDKYIQRSIIDNPTLESLHVDKGMTHATRFLQYELLRHGYFVGIAGMATIYNVDKISISADMFPLV